MGCRGSGLDIRLLVESGLAAALSVNKARLTPRTSHIQTPTSGPFVSRVGGESSFVIMKDLITLYLSTPTHSFHRCDILYPI